MIQSSDFRKTARWFLTFLPLLLPVVVITGSVCACDDDAAGPNDDEHSTAKRLWKEAGYGAYEFSQWRDCFCILGGQEVRLAVLNDSIIAGTLVDQNRELSSQEREWYLTVDSLFAFIEQVRAIPPASLIVEYDPILGYPRRVSVDYSTQIADDEITYRNAKLTQR